MKLKDAQIAELWRKHRVTLETLRTLNDQLETAKHDRDDYVAKVVQKRIIHYNGMLDMLHQCMVTLELL